MIHSIFECECHEKSFGTKFVQTGLFPAEMFHFLFVLHIACFGLHLRNRYSIIECRVAKFPKFQSRRFSYSTKKYGNSKIQKRFRDGAHTNCDAKRTSKSAGSPGARLSAFGPAGGEHFEDI
jgi:hypothetical protein